MKPLVSSILLLSLTSISFAQAPKISDQIVVTASTLPETVESTPAAVTVITKKDIEERAARDVADVLREVPGLTISRGGSPGKATSLFMRGAASTQTLVLWNGIEINNPYFAGYDWGRVSTAGVEQVEVVRGPFSSLYGSEAMAGVVNVLTTPRTSGLRAEVQSGSHGLRNALVQGAYVGSTLQLSAAIEHRQDDGFNPNDDFRQNSGNLFAKWAPSHAFSVGFAARHTSYDLGIPFNAVGQTLVPSPERRQNGNERQIALPIQQSLGRFSYELTLSESRREDIFRDPLAGGFTNSATDSTTRRARVLTRTTSPIGTIVLGGEGERATVDDSSNFGVNLEHNHRSSQSLFVEDRWSHETGHASRIELSAGARYDHFSTFGSQTSPRFALAFIEGGNKWRIAYGQGFRAPSVGELYFPFSGNPNLQAEQSRSVELGYDVSIGSGGLFSVTLFRSRFRDLIAFDNQTFSFANIGRVRSDGLEVGAEERIGRSLNVAVSYTYLRKNEDETTGERLLRRPKHGGSVAFGWNAGAIDTNLAVTRTGTRFDILAVAPYSRAVNAAYTTIDANLQYRAGRFTPFIKAENLANARYEEVLGYQSPLRRMILGLRFAIGGVR